MSTPPPASTAPGSIVDQLGAQLWSLRDDVLIEGSPRNGSITLCGRWGDVVIHRPGAVLYEALRRMRLGPVSLANVLDRPPSPGESATAEWAQLFLALDRLQHLIVRSLPAGDGEQALLSVEPLSDQARFDPKPIAPDRAVRLSVFAHLSTDGDMLRVDSPLALHRVLLHRPEAAHVVTRLSQAQRVADVAAAVRLPGQLTAAAVSYLVAAGVAALGEPDDTSAARPRFAEDHDPALRLWSRSDLSFHANSTSGRNDYDFGATYPFGEGPCPEPAVKPAPDGPRTRLYRPALDELLATDPPLTAVLESRRSVRRFSREPPTVRDVGELFYRAVRIRELLVPAGSRPEQAIAVDRPFPSGGALGELEFYLTVAACRGLDGGTYAYDAYRHELVRLAEPPHSTERLLGRARQAAGLEEDPPLLISVTARFGRVFWRYSGLGYALVIKHVGVVMQTLYLVSTAMGLGGCAIGSVDIEESSRILGTDWLAESAVGAFVLGRPAEAVEADEAGSVVRHPVNDADWKQQAALALLPV